MPIYEYVCEDCKVKFETLVMSRSEAIACPRCGGFNNSREFSVFGMKSVSSVGKSTFTSSMGGGCAGCSASSCAGCTPKR